jgi:hypothetical protein
MAYPLMKEIGDYARGVGVDLDNLYPSGTPNLKSPPQIATSRTLAVAAQMIRSHIHRCGGNTRLRLKAKVAERSRNFS